MAKSKFIEAHPFNEDGTGYDLLFVNTETICSVKRVQRNSDPSDRQHHDVFGVREVLEPGPDLEDTCIVRLTNGDVLHLTHPSPSDLLAILGVKDDPQDPTKYGRLADDTPGA